jgi:hypothetical protein
MFGDTDLFRHRHKEASPRKELPLYIAWFARQPGASFEAGQMKTSTGARLPQKPINIVAQLALLASFAALVLCRMPEIVLHGGRFWAEDGLVYFSNAWNQPWYHAWFATYNGYFNVAAGLGTWAALKLGGLAGAPIVTVGIGLLIQCLPIYVILTHEFPWRRSIIATGAAVLLCALVPVMGEVWLNTITSQFHLALFAALIFAAPLPATPLFLLDCAALVLAVFSGPASCFLMPLFVLRALLQRATKAVIFAAIVILGFCVQAAIYLAHVMPQRGGRLDLPELLSVISLHTIILQFSGFQAAQRFAAALSQVHALHQPLLAAPILLLLFYGVIGAAILRAGDMVLARLFVASLVITFFSFYEALNGTFAGFMNIVSGQRYAFMPIAANALLVIGLGCACRGVLRNLFSALALVLLLVGVTNYRSGLAMFNAGPAWRGEVSAWQRDPAHRLSIWPVGWVITLPQQPSVREP